MNRKHFVSSLIGLSMVPKLRTDQSAESGVLMTDVANDSARWTLPPYLNSGDEIGICCPAGFMTPEEIRPALDQIDQWGYKVRIGDTVGKRDFTFGGTDEERIQDFQRLLDDPSLKAILCARGGYGSIRIIDSLDFTEFVKKPKWIIGFSDVTVIHSHLFRNYRVCTIHSKMCNSFPDDWAKAEPVQMDSILSIKKALSGEKMNYELASSAYNRSGSAEGILLGGNLKTIETLSGTKSDLSTDGAILFTEDTGEYLYSIDRMFWNLKRTGKLNKLAGLIIGGFKIKPDDPGEEFGRTLADIVTEKVKDYNYPVCFDFPVGHQKENFALKCGVKHRLQVDKDQTKLVEL